VEDFGMECSPGIRIKDILAMEQNNWKHFKHEQCPECGDDLEVYNELSDGYIYDGDDTRCVGCSFRTTISVDQEVWIQSNV